MSQRVSEVLSSAKETRLYQACTPLIDCVAKTNPATWGTIGILGLCCVYKELVKNYVAPNTVLEVDMRGVELREVGPVTSGWMGLLPQEGVINAHVLTRTLLRAAKDDRIVGLVVTLDEVEATVAQLEDVREAVKVMRQHGKKTLIHTNSFKEMGNGLLRYWFASAFEEIYVPTIGAVNIAGLCANAVFVRSMLRKIDAVPHFIQRRKYKAAANMFMEEKLTKEHRESHEYMLTTFYDHIISDIAESRGMSVERVKELVSNGPYSAEKAHEAKLIDGIMYEDEFYDHLLPTKFPVPSGFFRSALHKMRSLIAKSAKEPKGINLLFSSHFYKRSGGSPYAKGKTKIAVINIIGVIHMGESETDWDGTETSAGATTVVLGLRQAIADKDVKAILLRVSSPGGSAVASDLIAQQVVAAKNAGKKVIVSMGEYAASGGYYVSCYANKIVANALTITGSIGVVAGKINLRGTWAKLGLTFDGTETSSNALFFDPLSSYDTADNQAKLETWCDDIYDTFKGHVAAGRKLADDQVETLAQGQIWMGSTAVQNGLVDVLGGLETAFGVVKSELGLPESTSLKAVSFPRSPSFFDFLSSVPQNSRQISGTCDCRAAGSPFFAGSFLSPFLFPAKLLRSLSSLAHLCHAASLLAKRSDVRALIRSTSQVNLSSFPNEISFSPSFSTSPLDFDLRM